MSNRQTDGPTNQKTQSPVYLILSCRHTAIYASVCLSFSLPLWGHF